MFRILVLNFLILFISQANAQYPELQHKTFAERYVAIDSVYYNQKILHLDSAQMFSEIKKLAAFAKASHDEELQLETQLMRSTYYMVGLQQDHRRGENLMLELRDKADSRKILQLQIRTREKLGYYYFFIAHKYGPAFDNYLRAYELVKNVPNQVFPGKQELIANVGTAYFNFGDRAMARKFFAEAQQQAPSYKKRFPINLQNTLGLIYRADKKYAQAERDFRKAYAMAQAKNDSTWMGIVAGNIGIIYFLQQNYDKAIPLLELDVKQSYQANEVDNALHSLTFLMKISQLRNQNEKLAKQLALARKMLPSTGSPIAHLRELYPIMARLEAVKGNYKSAYRYSDSAAMMIDSLYTQRNALLLAGVDKKIEIEKYHAKVERLQAQEKFRGLLIKSLVVVLLLLVVIMVLAVKRQRLLHRQKQQQLQAEKAAVESELSDATAKLAEFMTRIRAKRLLIDKYEAELKNAKVTVANNEIEINETTLQQLQEATILTDQQWEDFRKMFDKVHTGFMRRLKEKIPGLSPAETRFMVLSKLGLSNKEMAATLGISPEAIRLTRHRLRKKIATGNQTLEELIESI